MQLFTKIFYSILGALDLTRDIVDFLGHFLHRLKHLVLELVKLRLHVHHQLGHGVRLGHEVGDSDGVLTLALFAGAE